MAASSAIVLKFGGSVLPGPGALPRVVAEIRRFRATGRHSVVAVVSAFAGRTDALLAECRAAADPPSPLPLAARLALGERETAARLAEALDREGIAAAVLDPAALALRACGEPLDADPQDVATGVLRTALQRHGVAVVPGFLAVDGEGRTVLLGRGGSDLTALFLAQRLGARCRLLKDVGGLWVNSRSGGARRLERASWDELLAHGGRLVQQKAVEFARAHALPFEIAGLGAAEDARAVTSIGGLPADDAACG